MGLDSDVQSVAQDVPHLSHKISLVNTLSWSMSPWILGTLGTRMEYTQGGNIPLFSLHQYPTALNSRDCGSPFGCHALPMALPMSFMNTELKCLA